MLQDEKIIKKQENESIKYDGSKGKGVKRYLETGEARCILSNSSRVF